MTVDINWGFNSQKVRRRGEGGFPSSLETLQGHRIRSQV